MKSFAKPTLTHRPYLFALVETDVDGSEKHHIVGFRELECTKLGGDRVAVVVRLKVSENVRVDRAPETVAGRD